MQIPLDLLMVLVHRMSSNKQVLIKQHINDSEKIFVQENREILTGLCLVYSTKEKRIVGLPMEWKIKIEDFLKNKDNEFRKEIRNRFPFFFTDDGEILFNRIPNKVN